MIKEYAIDPAIAKDIQIFINTIDKFEFETPRRIGIIPRKWKRDVMRQLEDNAQDVKYDRKKAMVVSFLADILPYVSLKRDYEDNINGSWGDTVLSCHGQKPFHGIIHSENISGLPIISPDDVTNLNPAIKLDNFIKITKSIENFRLLLSDVLMQAKYLYFLDPYFDPYNPKCHSLFTEIFTTINSRADASKVDLRICTSSDRSNGDRQGPYSVGDEERMKQNIIERFSVNNLQNAIRTYLTPHDQGMHGRYLITDVAAFMFDHSLSIDPDADFTATLQPKRVADAIIKKHFK